MPQRTRIFVLLLGLVASAGCSAPPPPPPPVGDPDGTVARPLTDSVVALELSAFPRRASAACAANRNVVNVRAGQSIADAVAAAAPGTTIRVDPGTYIENAGESTALEWSTPNVCLEPSGPGRIVLNAAPAQGYAVSITGDDTVLRGFDLRGFQAAISMNATDGRTQHRVTIEDVTVSALTGPQRDGIVAYGDNRSSSGTPPTVDGLLLYNVTVSGADVGLSCNAGPCAHWWVEKSRVEGRTGSEDSGSDAIAVEEGRQIAIVDTTVRTAAADGIDLKARDAVVSASRVENVGRNGVKLWFGGDVIDTVVDGTNADASLIGDHAARYRYLRTAVTHHGDPGATQYVGTWGYDHPEEAGMDLEITDCTFSNNATGGLFALANGRVWFEHNRFADVGSKLLELSDGRQWMTTADDVVSLEQAGFGRGNLVG